MTPLGGLVLLQAALESPLLYLITLYGVVALELVEADRIVVGGGRSVGYVLRSAGSTIGHTFVVHPVPGGGVYVQGVARRLLRESPLAQDVLFHSILRLGRHLKGKGYLRCGGKAARVIIGDHRWAGNRPTRSCRSRRAG